jgi:hypothetical protein
MSTYKVGSEPDVMELIEQLVGTVIRDQRTTGAFDSVQAQRKALHSAAKTICDEAAKRHPDADILKTALANFEHAIEPNNWSATMLYEVFDIPFISSTALDPPELFDPLRRAMAARSRDWKEVTIDFEALSRLPVRAKVRPNVVRNHALEQALLQCRQFWLAHSTNLGWSRSALSHPDTLASFSPSELVGNCERFVVDMLTALGVQFTLRRLNGAWSALDKRLREGIHGSPA